MKKYLSGLVAIVLAVVSFAFTVIPSKSGPAGTNADPCSAASKKWFLISLECNEQVMVSDVRNPSNYTLSSTNEVTLLCGGSECVCAILACPVWVGVQYRPNIGQTTTIYTELYNYFNFGSNYGSILEKDQQLQRVAP
jgi:hypothetical protein